jgi:hypothetical protein
MMTSTEKGRWACLSVQLGGRIHVHYIKNINQKKNYASFLSLHLMEKHEPLVEHWDPHEWLRGDEDEAKPTRGADTAKRRRIERVGPTLPIVEHWGLDPLFWTHVKLFIGDVLALPPMPGYSGTLTTKLLPYLALRFISLICFDCQTRLQQSPSTSTATL